MSCWEFSSFCFRLHTQNTTQMKGKQRVGDRIVIETLSDNSLPFYGATFFSFCSFVYSCTLINSLGHKHTHID